MKENCIYRKEGRLRSLFPLPAEIVTVILRHVMDSQSTIYSASLVCKQWLFCATPLLYKHPVIKDTYRWATFILTLTRKKSTFGYGASISSLDLSKPVSKEEEKKGYPMEFPQLISVSTSSLLSVAQTCSHLCYLNLSDTFLFTDRLIVETGEYLSTLQYAIRPGLTQIELTLEQVIQTLGQCCPKLEKMDIRQTRWITAHAVWLFVYHCPQLKRLDVRRSPHCNVKRLTMQVLAEAPFQSEEDYFLPEAVARALNLFQTEEMTGRYIDRQADRKECMYQPDPIEDETIGTEPIHLLRLLNPITPGEPLENEIESTETSELSSLVENEKSLKELVYAVLMDARNMGIQDLDWLDHYGS
ncbi:hypothetical protein BY458DRAFT_483697 [Sporodiniella umbellata]|nr:hypothetical protein BY458DRAFT_483697 [Sporodiniella umbellata]